MLTLYQREECPHCALVRRTLSELDLTFTAVNVPRLGSERDALLSPHGLESAEVPVLLDDDTVVQGSAEIDRYLRRDHASTRFGDPPYGLTRYLDDITHGDAVAHVTAKLADEGFGVLTEIDVRATMKTKLDVDFPNYVILGACNPPLAHQALTEVPAIGLLLPCNVVVAEEPDGRIAVSALDPMRLFSLVGRDDIEPLAADVRSRLQRALSSL